MMTGLKFVCQSSDESPIFEPVTGFKGNELSAVTK